MLFTLNHTGWNQQATLVHSGSAPPGCIVLVVLVVNVTAVVVVSVFSVIFFVVFAFAVVIVSCIGVNWSALCVGEYVVDSFAIFCRLLSGVICVCSSSVSDVCC